MLSPSLPALAAAAALACITAFGAADARAQSAPQGRYLFDILKQPAYKAAWTRMVGQLGPRENWLRAGSITGPGGPSSRVMVDGATFERADTCKIHDCGDNQFYALFAPAGARAVGALVQPGRTRFFGAPTPGEQRALLGR